MTNRQQVFAAMLVVAASLALAVAATGQTLDYCGNFPDSKQPKPIDLSRPLPPVWVWQTDPDFGGEFVRLTGAITTAGAKSHTPMYSTVSPWSRDGKFFISYIWSGGGHQLWNAETLTLLRPVFGSGITGQNTGARPSDLEQIMWINGETVLFPSKYAPGSGGPVPNLMEYNVKTKVMKIRRNFEGPPTNCVKGTDELEMGNDPQWNFGPLVGLQCGQESSSTPKRQKKWVYDWVLDMVYPVIQADGITVAPYVLPRQDAVFFEGQILNLNLQPIVTLKMSSQDNKEHANGVMGDSRDWYCFVSFDPPAGEKTGLVVCANTVNGSRKYVVAPSTGWGTYPPSGSHITGVHSQDPRARGWGVASTTSNGNAPVGTFERMLLGWNVDSGKVCRYARHMSKGPDGPAGYQGEAHPVCRILPVSGTKECLFASDWGFGVADLFLLRVVPGEAAPPTPTPPPPTPTPSPSVTPTPTPTPTPVPTPTPHPSPPPDPGPSCGPVKRFLCVITRGRLFKECCHP